MGRAGRPLEARQMTWRDDELAIVAEVASQRRSMLIRLTFTADDLPILAAALEGVQQ
jgi:hypothetical protein